MDEAGLVEGRERMRARAPSEQTVTPTQIEIFLTVVAETCNVARSARAAGFSASWAYRLRQRDAGFRAGWAAAVRDGYAKLELVLLERAIKGTPKAIMRRDGSEKIIREYSTALAVALLRRHAETADSAEQAPDEQEMAEMRARILDKLERIRRREEQAGGGGAGGGGADGGAGGEAEILLLETKSTIDRVEIVRWLLRRRARAAGPGSGRG